MGDVFNPDFRDFLQALNDAGVDYLLVGGYAVILHGRSRTTGDMDVWVKPNEENHRKLFLMRYLRLTQKINEASMTA